MSSPRRSGSHLTQALLPAQFPQRSSRAVTPANDAHSPPLIAFISHSRPDRNGQPSVDYAPLPSESASRGRSPRCCSTTARLATDRSGPKSAYRVDTFERTLHEGESADPAVTAGKPKESELLRRLISTDPDERMPKDGDPLPPEQVALVQRRIEEGAQYDGQAPQTPLVNIVPPVDHPPAPQAYVRPIPITALAFSADGQELFIGGFHEITVWNPATGEPLRRIGREGQRTFALALTHDNKYLAAGSGFPGRLGEVRLFDPVSGNLEKVLTRTTDVVYDVAPSPKDNRLALAAADNSVRIFDLDSGQEKLTVGIHSDWVFAVAWSPDATKLASGSRDKTARVFDVATGDSLATYSGHTDAVRGVAFHPDGAQVYSCGADKRINLWKAADGTRTSEFNKLAGEAFKLAAAGEFFFVPSADKTVRQFPLAELKLAHDYPGSSDWVLCGQPSGFKPHGRRLF